MSFRRAADLVSSLADAGVATWCVCPGGRNAPLVVVLERAHGISALSFHDERSAAFFALGRARATGAPVAVVTTSGTAAAELLPAAVEAHYSAVPLVLVTADRPPHYRGTGSPQTIEQVGLFGDHAPTLFDGAADADRLDLSEWDGRQPVHVNICFDEPLTDGDPPTLRLSPGRPRQRERQADPAPLLALLGEARRPLVLLGPLDGSDHAGVRDFVVRLGAAVFAEAASGLREDPALAHLRIEAGERVLRGAGFDGVLRIGGVPTLRLWRDLETTLRGVPACSIARTTFPGLTRGEHLTAAPGILLGALAPAPIVDGAWRDALLARDRQRLRALDGLWTAHPRAEPAMIRALSAAVPTGSLVYLGNSLPIREWDLAALHDRRWTVGVNRGANGIDGQLSTFLGMCAPDREHWAVLGDLTALYDLGAPWILPRLTAGPVRIVVVNNGGGQIFRRLFPYAELRNEHGMAFERWAGMWDLAYRRWDAVPADAALPDRVIIELVPDAAQTDAFWRAFDALD